MRELSSGNVIVTGAATGALHPPSLPPALQATPDEVRAFLGLQGLDRAALT